MVEVDPMVGASKDLSILQLKQMVRSFLLPVIVMFEWIQSWNAIHSFYCSFVAIVRTSDFICSRLVSCCLRLLHGERVSISRVVECYKNCCIHVVELCWLKKILEVCSSSKKTVTLIVTGDAIGVFTVSGSDFPFLVDLSAFLRRFRLESKTSIIIYLNHDVRVIGEVHCAIDRKCLLESLTIFWYEINFRAQNGTNCSLCRIVGRISCFIVIVNHIRRKRNVLRFRKALSIESHCAQVLVNSFTTGWLRWQLEEASCCCWRRFQKNVFSK